MATSSQSGMGPLPFPGGAGFRVWAPNASHVAVAGEFNHWSMTAHPLTSEGNGYWSTDVFGAQAGQQYKYVIVNGAAHWRKDPYALEVTRSDGNAVIHQPDFDWSGDHFTMPAWNELVIYELHVGTFNPPFPGAPGRFDGVIEKLDYLRDLGINAIEIMPAGEFPGTSSLGYNPAHLFAIETDYGGVNALRRLIKAAHARGIAVLLDVVYNHMAHSDLDLWQFDGWSENGKGGIYFYNDAHAATPWGETRFDYGRAEVRQILRDNALHWLEAQHLDGLRWDATRFIHNVTGGSDPSLNLDDGWRLMQWVNSEVKARQPWKLIIAEDLHDNPRINQEPQAGGAGFGSQWDTRFLDAVRNALKPPADEARNVLAVRDALYHRFNASAFERVIYTESHDANAFNESQRLPEEIWPGNGASWAARKRSTLGACLVLTAPGIPMLFQGQEFLEDGRFTDHDPLDWQKANHHQGILKLYRDLIRLRRNWFNHTRGLRGQYLNVHHLNAQDKVLAYHRWEAGGPGDDVVVVLNFSQRAFPDYRVGLPALGRWRVRFNSDWNGYSQDFANTFSVELDGEDSAADGLAYSGRFALGSYSALILSQDNP